MLVFTFCLVRKIGPFLVVTDWIPQDFLHELTRNSPFSSASPPLLRCAVIIGAHCIWPFYGFWESDLRSSGLHQKCPGPNVKRQQSCRLAIVVSNDPC